MYAPVRAVHGPDPRGSPGPGRQPAPVSPDEGRQRRPMFTKPAGVFLQLLGAAAVIVGVMMFAAAAQGPGVVALIVGVGLLWLGRQTR